MFSIKFYINMHKLLKRQEGPKDEKHAVHMSEELMKRVSLLEHVVDGKTQSNACRLGDFSKCWENMQLAENTWLPAGIPVAS